MTVWVVRGGRHGEFENWALAHHRAAIGWHLPDLSACFSAADVRRLVEASYPEKTSRSHASITGQVWAFRSRITPGDMVVMPLKSRPGHLQFGTVTGSYIHDAQADSDRRHQLPVKWAPDPVAKTLVGQDLVYSLNSISTIFSVTRNNAEGRLAEVAAGRNDPEVELHAGREQIPAPSDPEGSSTVSNPETAPTVEAVRDRIRAHVGDEYREHDLTHLVAEILEALGYHCEVSPPGPDGGVDIVAGRGPLGLDSPTLIVEVKSERTRVDVKVVRGLHSAMMQHQADQALLVAWGGVTAPATREFRRDRTTLRVWDADDLLTQLFNVYPQLSHETRARIPLRQVWVLDDEE